MDLCAHLSGSESTAVACLLELDAGTKKMPDNAFPVVLVLPGRERSPSDPFRYLAKGCPCGHWVDGSPEWILVSLEKSVHVSSFPSPAFFFFFFSLYFAFRSGLRPGPSQNSFTSLQPP